jgi:hypothetical protein
MNSIRNSLGIVGRSRRAAITVATGLVAVAMLATAGPAAADVEAGYDAQAMETVICDTSTHNVKIVFNVYGEDSGQTDDNYLDPHEIIEPVWLKVWEWTNNNWVISEWHQIVSGVSSVNIPVTGTTYWYFQWAFQTPSGGFDYRGEYAGGAGDYGIYSNPLGYHAVSACYS